MPRPVAYLTLADRGDFVFYDHLTFGPMAERGWTVGEIPWDAAGVDWGRYAAVVIRSPWDYQDRPSEFLAVLEGIESLGVPLLNGTRTVRWNLQKGYLRDLATAGVSIVPTRWPEDGAADDWFADGLDEVVVKPLVGANADDTFRIRRSDAATLRAAREAFAGRECMVQPFLRSVVERGEYSLFYFGGEYSHCVLKRPATGDFRVQEEHGGTITAADPPDGTREIARRALASAPEPTLYARVDFVRLDDGAWAVIELELIEPSLYFPYDGASPDRFAEAFDKLMTGPLRVGSRRPD